MIWPPPGRENPHILGPHDVTIDHKTPLCRGGEDKDYNLAACCRHCNQAKGNLTEDEFREFLE